MDHYFIYRNGYPVRIEENGMHAFVMERDGSESDTADAYKVACEGREVTKEEALRWWAEHPR